MKVELIASTTMNPGGGIGKCMELHDNLRDTDPDVLAEFAGRACYQSFHKPNPKTRENADYLANILNQGHESVLEHASATFYVQGVSRALTHELIRHRHLSFSELSQRFVNVEEADYVTPPAIKTHADDAWSNLGSEDGQVWHFNDLLPIAVDQTTDIYSELVRMLTAKGLPRKQAREAARAVMPNATETKIVITGNMRAWRDVLKKRWSVHADAEICEFAGEVLKHLKNIAPGSFQDIPDTPFGSEDN